MAQLSVLTFLARSKQHVTSSRFRRVRFPYLLSIDLLLRSHTDPEASHSAHMGGGSPAMYLCNLNSCNIPDPGSSSASIAVRGHRLAADPYVLPGKRELLGPHVPGHPREALRYISIRNSASTPSSFLYTCSRINACSSPYTFEKQ